MMIIERNDEFIIPLAAVKVGAFQRGRWACIKDQDNTVTHLTWGESLYESLVLLLNERQRNGYN